jgi:NADPH:quinone reductase-like Zn-dependent oxidoreductase
MRAISTTLAVHEAMTRGPARARWECASPPGSCRFNYMMSTTARVSTHPLPFTPGMEAGVVRQPPGCQRPPAGDRVAYAMSMGSYAEQAIVPAWMLVPIPNTVGRTTAAAAAQGMTAHYLTRSAFPLREGHTAPRPRGRRRSGFSWFR